MPEHDSAGFAESGPWVVEFSAGFGVQGSGF